MAGGSLAELSYWRRGGQALAALVEHGLLMSAFRSRFRTKVIGVDPRGARAAITRIAERPRRIAEGVSTAVDLAMRIGVDGLS
jgi:hypothetical protein